jgi:Icc-related predicted phosphoesterase
MVKLLCISDTVVSQMENAAHLRRRYNDVDLLVSCGDMPSAYLEFITSVLGVPLFYVRGNHDTEYETEPPGGENLHNRLIRFRGLTFFGIEGSPRYNNSPIQYTDGEMMRFVLSKWLALRYRRWRVGYGLDVFVTHAPARDLHDMPDKPHRGLVAFRRFLEWYRPRYMLHGHVHTWDRRTTTVTQYLDTRVMNINPVTLLDVELDKETQPVS